MKTRIEQLRQKIRDVTDEDPTFGTTANCPPELEEAFLESVLAFESSPRRRLLDVLGELGVELPQPKRLIGKELTAKLWEVIHALVGQSVILCNTDHLSDRELYALLWKKTLRREFVISSRHTLNIDMTEDGGETGMAIYLKHYATEEQRQMYSEVYPNFKMPAHVDPPKRRDHLIPARPLAIWKKHVN
jgi:hypothetical protein